MKTLLLLLVASGSLWAAEDLVKTLGMIEQQFLADWKNHRLDSFRANIADDGIAWSGFGIFDKKAQLDLQLNASSSCSVSNYELSDLRVLQPDKHTAILMYRLRQEALCGGVPATSPLMNASVYARRKGKWLNVFRTSQPQYAPAPAPVPPPQ